VVISLDQFNGVKKNRLAAKNRQADGRFMLIREDSGCLESKWDFPGQIFL
jgi:hypothetical protein